jgi:hypothetical protein
MADNDNNNENNRAKSHLHKPPTFDGKNYQVWMMATELCIHANKKAFQSNKSKVLFSLSFMTEGMPMTWALDFNKDEMLRGVWNFRTWAAFKKKLKASFEDQEKAKNSQTALHQLRQGTHTADKFFLEFKLLRQAAGITDNRELIAFLEGGAINRKILTHIYYLNNKLPTSYKAWKKKIIKINRLHQHMEMWDTPAS